MRFQDTPDVVEYVEVLLPEEVRHIARVSEHLPVLDVDDRNQRGAGGVSHVVHIEWSFFQKDKIGEELFRLVAKNSAVDVKKS